MMLDFDLFYYHDYSSNHCNITLYNNTGKTSVSSSDASSAKELNEIILKDIATNNKEKSVPEMYFFLRFG